MTEPPTPLERYADRLRRPRLVYFAVVTAIVVALAVVAGVAYSHGEVAHTTLHTAAAPPSLPVGVPTQLPVAAWNTTDRAAVGAAQWGGTVVTYDKHTVRGRNARTGKQTWSYSRSDRTVCTAAQLGGVTMAVYELAGNCDEVTAVDSATGARRWTRTLDMDGMPLYGHPTFRTSTQGTYNTLLIVTGSVLYALDPASGYNRWTYSRFGCRVTDAALGSNGALISQNCTDPTCTGLKFCGKGRQLFLRNAFDSYDDNCKTNPTGCKDNPDRIIWNRIGNTAVPVSADGVISAYDAGAKALVQVDGKNGASVATTTLTPAPASGSAIRVATTTSTELVWAAGVTYAVNSGTGVPVWTARTEGPPTVTANTGSADALLSTARITVPSTAGAWLLDGNSGRIAQTFTLPSAGTGDVVLPLGTGFLVTRRDGAVAYR